MARRKLTDEEIQDALLTLPGWQLHEGKLTKQFKFASFAQALGWMVAVGMEADKMDHHPEWTNVYSRVSVALVTHDLGNAVSSWDVDLAKKMDELAN
ncbi:4a-hydroxytetrahydrobiopterin dehydratase [Candidatus Leptofilum sp.]|uniref:4a-hydroxytetrahydrobiopterin dehydratase n=1 Tax=Candidatus Leptofilum sp. TaxID=3241576 RepID=UPI003B5A26F9